MTKPKISELEAREKWSYNEISKIESMDDLKNLYEDMMSYEHDYGSIVSAMGAFAAAAAWMMNNDKDGQGGISGFQSGGVMWEFLRGWGSVHDDSPGYRLTNYENLLYPQYAEKFSTIPKDILESVQEKAIEYLKEWEDTPEDQRCVSSNVLDHWEFLAGGGIPFGLRIE